MSPANQTFRFRESRRLLREAAVRLSAPGEGGELSAWTRDIATGGMFVSTPTPMPVGTAAHFLLHLGSDDEPADVEGEATVVWVRPEAGGADQPAGMGMQFGRVEPPGEERLAWLFSERQGDGDVVPQASSREAEQAEAQQPEARDVGAEAAAETVESDAHGEAPGAVEPLEIFEAEAAGAPAPEPPGDDRPSSDPPPAAEDSAAAGEAQAPRAELFDELAADGDGDYWSRPASRFPPWLWPAVGVAALLAALIAFRGPLMNLVGGPGDAPPEEGAPAEAPSFEVSAPEAAAGVVPEGAEEAEEPSAASRQFMPQEEEQAADAAAPDDSAAAEPAGPISTETAEAAAAGRPLPDPATPAVETEPAAEPPAAEPAAVSRPPVPAAPAPPVNATALRSITASTAGDRTVVEIVGNAPFRRHHVMSLEAPPRLVVRLIGVRQDFDASGVGGPGLRGVRTGVHGRGTTRNLHVVLDLTASDVAATVERRGDRVVVDLTH